ncbi:MAG TPA: PTS sugar transporter subunit IIB [Bacillota bacterium]|nr:PTS sugar transporter subunit IIB [Bacillota bacterium]
MIRITLVCAEGMSTSLLVTSMQDAAEKKGIEVSLNDTAKTEIHTQADKTDILLLGPQVRYLLGKLKSELGGKIPVIEVINMADYGLMKGEKVLDDALALYNSKQNI